MRALGYICDWFEKVGAVNFHRSSFVRKNRLQSVYVFVNSAVLVVFLSAQMLSTFTRAIRYTPEFFQALVDDLVFLLVTICILEFQLKYRQLGKLNDFMEHSFTQAYPKIRNKCMSDSRAVFHIFSAIIFIATSGNFMETMLPISESDLEILRYVYRTKHPERQLPVNLRVPFLDETESWSYEILYAISFYALFLHWIWSTVISSLTPILLIHVKGQYAILCKYVTMIGAEHRDSQGNRIYYTDIEKNEYVFKMDTKDKNQNRKYNEIYERLFLRQIVLFHQKLLLFRSEVSIPH